MGKRKGNYYLSVPIICPLFEMRYFYSTVLHACNASRRNTRNSPQSHGVGVRTLTAAHSHLRSLSSNANYYLHESRCHRLLTLLLHFWPRHRVIIDDGTLIVAGDFYAPICIRRESAGGVKYLELQAIRGGGKAA